MKNMTALVSAYVRCYHTINSNIKIYNDNISTKILTSEEYELISDNMKNGISFFNPNYEGNNPLQWIVNNQLAPSVLARSIFNERHLLNEIKLGLKQYVILASGYDTSAYKVNDKVKVYEIDKSNVIDDKKQRIKKSHISSNNVTYIGSDFNCDWVSRLMKTDYDKTKKTFCSLLGLSYYLDKDIFDRTIGLLTGIIPIGSVILFDYPNDNETEKEKINRELASAASEQMKSKYSYSDIEEIASENNLLIYEHLNSNDMDNDYFYDYNTLNPTNKILAPRGISYCMFVKRG